MLSNILLTGYVSLEMKIETKNIYPFVQWELREISNSGYL